MRHGPAGRRLRNRGGGSNNGGGGGGNSSRRAGGGNGGGNRNQVFDSNGPDVRIRGTAHQIQEKYATLAKDASSSGDFVLAESYLQHAEHYQRVINGWMEQSNRETYSYQDDDEQEDGFRTVRDRRFDVRTPHRPEHESLELPSTLTAEAPVRRTEMADA